MLLHIINVITLNSILYNLAWLNYMIITEFVKFFIPECVQKLIFDIK